MTRYNPPSRERQAEAAQAAVNSEAATRDDRPFSELRTTLHQALGLLSVRRWFFFIPFCITASAIFVGSLDLPRLYTARTRFERRDDPVFMNLPQSMGTASFKYFRQTLERDITAPEYMAEVVEKLGFTDDLPRDDEGNLTSEGIRQRDGLSGYFAGFISIFSKERSEHLDLIEVRYTGPDAKVGRRLVDEVKRTYIRRTQVRIREHLESQREWYDARIAEATEQVSEAKRKLGEIHMDHPYAYLSDPGSMAQRVEATKRERRELSLQRNALVIRLSAEEQLLATQPPVAGTAQGAKSSQGRAKSISSSAEAQRLSERLVEINDEIATLRVVRGMTEEHPDVLELRVEYQRVTRHLVAQVEADHALPAGSKPEDVSYPITPAGSGWYPERARILVAIGALQRQIEDLDAILVIADQRLAELEAAKKNVFDNQEFLATAQSEVSQAELVVMSYRKVLNRIQPALKANDMGRAVRFSEEQPALGSSIAVSPKAQTIILAGLFAGLCMGVIFTILAELVDHIYRASNQVARSLGLTILETIDVIVTTADRRRQLVRKIVVMPIVVGMGLGAVGVTAAAAYLSLESPADYERLRGLPAAILRPFRSSDNIAQRPSHKGSTPDEPAPAAEDGLS